MFKTLFNYIKDLNLKVIYFNNKLDIINYKKILIFNDDKIKVECPKKIMIVLGNNLSIKKMYDEELLIEGNIKEVKWEDIYE
ncbi:MAG: hypothetical protein E7172_01315 [Firmicutes bacterium]|nr:hypothetical protein [Bacillota bacterium]